MVITHRTEGVSWWPQEVCSYEEIRHAYETLDACNWTVDYVITHTAPRQFKRLYAGTDFRKDKTGCKTADFLTSICDDLPTNNGTLDTIIMMLPIVN